MASALIHYKHAKVIVTIISDVLIHWGVEKTRLDYQKRKQLMKLKQCQNQQLKYQNNIRDKKSCNKDSRAISTSVFLEPRFA